MHTGTGVSQSEQHSNTHWETLMWPLPFLCLYVLYLFHVCYTVGV